MNEIYNNWHEKFVLTLLNKTGNFSTEKYFIYMYSNNFYEENKSMGNGFKIGDTTFSYGGVDFTYTDGKSSVQKYTTKFDNNGNKIYCVWYNTPDGTLAHKTTTLYMEYPQQRNAGVIDGQFMRFNKASIQGSSRPNDITLSECYNCTVDISKTNNSTKTVDGLGDNDNVYIFDGANNTVKAGNYDTVMFQDKWNGTQMYYGGLRGLTKGTYNQEQGKIK